MFSNWSNVNNEKCFLHALYRSSSQSHEELERFSSNLDLLLRNINNQHRASSIVIEDFNNKYSKWCTTDKDKVAGITLDSTETTAVYSQMINKPTYLNELLPWINFEFSLKYHFCKKLWKWTLDLWKMSSQHHPCNLRFTHPAALLLRLGLQTCKCQKY